MKKDIKKDYQLIQRLFLKIRVKDYFRYVYDVTNYSPIKDDFYLIRQYTNLDENYIYDFSDWTNTDYNENATIGDLLSAARKMMYENDDAVYEESLKKEAEETAIKIVNAILLKPFAELAEVYRKKEDDKI